MIEIMTNETNKLSEADKVKKLIPESIGKEIDKQTQGIFPLKDVVIQKVKVLKKPKFDITRLMELHQGGDEDAGAAIGRPEAEEAQNTLTADMDATATATEE